MAGPKTSNTMKRSPLLLLFGLCALRLYAQTQDFSPRANRLQQHVEFLASDALRGREAGTDDALRAAQYIVSQFSDAGLKPLYQNWLVPFSAPSSDYSSVLGDKLGSQVDGIMNSMSDGKSFHNVVAVIEGSDSLLRQEIIIIGAHYDHLGVKNGKIFNGADDNASGTAAVIELARALMQQRDQLKRTVILCAFDAEELGLYGSKALARQLENQKNIRLMMSIDMVGWYKQSGYLELMGTGTLVDGRSMAKELAQSQNLKVRCKSVETSIFTATDTEPFAKQGIPTLAITTGTKSPYHKPEDDAELIDYEGLDQIVEYLSSLTLKMSQDPSLCASGRLALKHGGRDPLFSMGVSLGLNHTRLNFPGAAFTTRNKLGWECGLPMRFTLNPIVISSGLYYTHGRTQIPTLDPATSSASYTQTNKLRLNSLTIPIGAYYNFGARTPNIDVLLGGGIYFSNLLSPDTAAGFPTQDAFGWHIGYEMKVGCISWSLSGLWQINSLLKPSETPRVLPAMTRFSLTYYLW